MAITTTRYDNVHGVPLSVTVGGVSSVLLPDPQGNIVGRIDSTQTVVGKTWYWPYGERRTGSHGLRLGYGGAWGYYTDASTSRLYIRARYLKPNWTRWLTVDPLWPSEKAFLFCKASPALRIDPSGMTCTALKPSEGNCDIYKQLCNRGYVFACNSYYACRNTGDSPEANCVRCCLQTRLSARLNSGGPGTCQDWINDHTVCFDACGYANSCTTPYTLNMLCNGLMKDDASCKEAIKVVCGWPTPCPSCVIRPPRKPWKCINGKSYDCNPRPPCKCSTIIQACTEEGCISHTDPI